MGVDQGGQTKSAETSSDLKGEKTKIPVKINAD